MHSHNRHSPESLSFLFNVRFDAQHTRPYVGLVHVEVPVLLVVKVVEVYTSRRGGNREPSTVLVFLRVAARLLFTVLDPIAVFVFDERAADLRDASLARLREDPAVR